LSTEYDERERRVQGPTLPFIVFRLIAACPRDTQLFIGKFTKQVEKWISFVAFSLVAVPYKVNEIKDESL
jgi:hypothetical protein